MEENQAAVPQSLPTEDKPYILPSVENQNGVKNKLLISGLGFFIVVMIASTSFLFLSGTSPQTVKKNTAIQSDKNLSSSAPVADAPSNVTVATEYKNPFDAKTQYTNPFDETKNPFDALDQLVQQQ